MTTLCYGIAILLFLAGSAFFSASEMALSAANGLRLSAMAEEGNKRAGIAYRLVTRFDDALSAILIGNNLCNIGSDALATVMMMSLLGERYNGLWAVATTIFMTVIIIVFCESGPKIGAKKHATRWAVALAGIIRGLCILLWPIIFLVKILIRLLTLPLKGERYENTEEEAAAELQSAIETAGDEGVIDEERSERMLSALEFSEIPVLDIMTARVDVEALDVDDDWRADLLGEHTEMPFSRIPVYKESIDNIIGILPINRFFRALLDDEKAEIRDYLMEPQHIYKTVKLPGVLNKLRQNQQHLAIVTDEYGGTLGIVTLEDVLEQIVGEIWDETDEVETRILPREDGKYELDGDLPIAEFADLLDMKEEDLTTDSTTAGGWTLEEFGKFPKEGDTLEADGVSVEVLEMDEDGRRVEKILVEKIERDKEDPAYTGSDA